jgi:hypothetical protein
MQDSPLAEPDLYGQGASSPRSRMSFRNLGGLTNDHHPALTRDFAVDVHTVHRQTGR